MDHLSVIIVIDSTKGALVWYISIVIKTPEGNHLDMSGDVKDISYKV